MVNPRKTSFGKTQESSQPKGVFGRCHAKIIKRKFWTVTTPHVMQFLPEVFFATEGKIVVNCSADEENVGGSETFGGGAAVASVGALSANGTCHGRTLQVERVIEELGQSCRCWNVGCATS